MRENRTERLRTLALQAIEEASAEALGGTVRPTRGLAVALAWLLYFGKPGSPLPRWPFINFWEALTVERDHDRQAAITAAANAIYLALGEKREMLPKGKLDSSRRSERL